MPSSQSNPEPTPPWLELRNGVHAYTDDDGGDATTLTVCDSSQAWLNWLDSESGEHCTHQPKGVSVTISSDKIVAIDLGPNNLPRYVVFIRADDSSWSGWTGTLGLMPRIPPHTLLHVGGLDARLAPKQDSSLTVGDDLPKGTVAELISQDPKSDRDLYVRVGDRRGWLFSLDVADEVTFRPAKSSSLTWQFDCGDLAPRSHFYDTGDYGRAFTELEPLVNERCAEAEHLLGVMYAQGRGVRQDFVRAYASLLLAYSDGISPVGKTAVIPVLGDDEAELEIVQFGAQLTTNQLDAGEILAKELAQKRGKFANPETASPAKVANSAEELRPRIAGYKRQHFRFNGDDSPEGAVQAGESPLSCASAGVAQIIVTDLFNHNPGAQTLGLKAEEVRLWGVLPDGSCLVEVQTNHGYAMKYKFRFDENGNATLDLVP